MRYAWRVRRLIGKYEIVYADPPWDYPKLIWRTQLADGSYRERSSSGARKHYPTITDAAMLTFPMRSVMVQRSVLFLWATCPRLDFAVDCIKSWGLYYRGIAYVWVKTRKQDGVIIGAKGPPPAFVKPVTELLLVATTIPHGRVFPILDYAQRQVVLHPVGRHSEKPAVFRQNIIDLCGDRSRIELFARTRTPGWDVWGNEVP